MADDQKLTPEQEAAHEAIDKQVEENRKKLHRLQREGVQMDPGELMERRMDVLVEFLLGGADSDRRLEFELLWHQRFEKILDNVREQVNRQKILRKDIPGNGKLEIPGRG